MPNRNEPNQKEKQPGADTGTPYPAQRPVEVPDQSPAHHKERAGEVMGGDKGNKPAKHTG